MIPLVAMPSTKAFLLVHSLELLVGGRFPLWPLIVPQKSHRLHRGMHFGVGSIGTEQIGHFIVGCPSRLVLVLGTLRRKVSRVIFNPAVPPLLHREQVLPRRWEQRVLVPVGIAERRYHFVKVCLSQPIPCFSTRCHLSQQDGEVSGIRRRQVATDGLRAMSLSDGIAPQAVVLIKGVDLTDLAHRATDSGGGSSSRPSLGGRADGGRAGGMPRESELLSKNPGAVTSTDSSLFGRLL
mmetsp:Transcript_11231/g.28726  ORF Transcript_11231/g.28726 Transcript_11231/m.28726 type:complete len:238 (+) Transcript_11231:516-1229(+)